VDALAPLLALCLAASARAAGVDAAQAPDAGEPVKSAPQILALIPAPPKSVDEARRRRGRVRDPKGREAEVDLGGSEAIRALFARAYAARAAARRAPPPARVELSPEEDAALKALGEGAHAMINESAAAAREFEKAVSAEGDALKTRLRAGKSADDARAAYLRREAGLAADFRSKVAAWVAQGDALVAAARAKIAEPRFASRARSAADQLAAQQDLLLWELVRANDAIVVAATDKAPAK